MARTDPRPNYGRKRRIGTDGYIYIFEPQHPLAYKYGYVLEHRKVAWDNGLLTDPVHQIHHVNGDRTDNRLANLSVVSASEHTLLHWDERGRPTHCPQGHLYDEENTAFNPSGWRYCKTCNRERVRRYNARKREQAAA
jgi:hypothetical protein